MFCQCYINYKRRTWTDVQYSGGKFMLPFILYFNEKYSKIQKTRSKKFMHFGKTPLKKFSFIVK